MNSQIFVYTVIILSLTPRGAAAVADVQRADGDGHHDVDDHNENRDDHSPI